MEVKITLSECELQEKKLHKNTQAIAKHLFEVHGFLKIENLFPKVWIQTLADAVLSNFEGFSRTEVANLRYIVNLPFASPFNDKNLYANPILLSLMQEFLGPHFIFSSLGCVVSLPGSTDQHVHADYFPLFEENTSFNGIHPPFAVTIAVPLIDIDLLNGPTKVWSGSHRTYPIDQQMESYPLHRVFGSMGSCYFWDYRTFHAGGSNHSETLRPLLYFSYIRRWFRDALNPDKLEVKKEEYEKISEEHRKLFCAF